MRTEEQKKKACEAVKRYYEKNKEKVKLKAKEYKLKNSEKIKEYDKKRRNEPGFKEKRCKQHKLWREKNPNYGIDYYWNNPEFREKKNEKHKEWLDKNKDKQVEASKLHALRNPEKAKAR